jgi:hypothetical protein
MGERRRRFEEDAKSAPVPAADSDRCVIAFKLKLRDFSKLKIDYNNSLKVEEATSQ